MKTIRIIAVALVAAIAASATSAAWAAKRNAPHEDRGWKTYLPGEGGCKDDLGFGWTNKCD
jgi:hypothetical protein